MSEKERADIALVRRGLAASREKALYENLTNPQELPGFVLHP